MSTNTKNDDNNVNRYFCSLCNYAAINNSNLHVHFRSKKHMKREKAKKSNNLFLQLSQVTKDIRNELEICKESCFVDNMLNQNIEQLKKELNDSREFQCEFITKTSNDINYICTECSQTFEHKNSYKTHTYKCQQISNKYESLVDANIELICQIKLLLNVRKNSRTNEQSDTHESQSTKTVENYNHMSNVINELKKSNEKLKFKNDTFKKQYKDLENQIILLKDKCNVQYEQIIFLEKQINTLENKKNTLENQQIIHETNISHLHSKYNYLKEKYNKIKIKREIDLENKIDELKTKVENSSINRNFNGNFNGNFNNNNVTIVLNNNPPFEYINPFINKSTKMPYNYEKPEEMRVLMDNQNQNTEIKAKLCNGIAFYTSHNNREFYDLIATCITVAYQKEDPKARSIVNTDTTRNSFHVRMTDETGKINYWHYDKMGEKLGLLLFKPTREYIIEAVRAYVYYCSQKFLSNKEEFTYPYSVEDHKIYRDFVNGNSELFSDDPVTYKKYRKLFATLDDIQGIVRETNFNSEILSKISTKFFLDKKQHKLINGKNTISSAYPTYSTFD